MTFESFSFDQRIAAGIKACGYVTPTPIQTRAIPAVLQGRDVMGLAETGTGKTAAFALPILQRLLNDNVAKRGAQRILVLAPTRELALQIHENFISMGKETGIRSAAVFGGVGFTPQVKAFHQATVIVACPGRLVRLLNKGVITLDRIDTLVLDEADRMLDMGFMPDIKRILARLPIKRQNLLFSATMPADIRKLADTILVDPTTVQVANTAPVASVSHAFYPVRTHLKVGLLESLLKTTEHDTMLIFTRTKHKAKNLARRLVSRGHNATFLQGNMSQNQRQRALDGFKDGTFSIMVATDIAARGIDCDRISHVINFDMPDTAETYTHRIGRTGRAGRTGQAMTLVSQEDKLPVRAIERIISGRIETVTVEGFDYDEPGKPQPAGDRGRPQNPGKRSANAGRGRRPAKGRKSIFGQKAGR